LGKGHPAGYRGKVAGTFLVLRPTRWKETDWFCSGDIGLRDHRYLGDVFVVAEFRGLGLAKWLIDCIIGHPELQGLRRWILATQDAHGLYEKFGFTPLKKPDVFMERHDPDVYRSVL